MSFISTFLSKSPGPDQGVSREPDYSSLAGLFKQMQSMTSRESAVSDAQLPLLENGINSADQDHFEC